MTFSEKTAMCLRDRWSYGRSIKNALEAGHPATSPFVVLDTRALLGNDASPFRR